MYLKNNETNCNSLSLAFPSLFLSPSLSSHSEPILVVCRTGAPCSRVPSIGHTLLMQRQTQCQASAAGASNVRARTTRQLQRQRQTCLLGG